MTKLTDKQLNKEIAKEKKNTTKKKKQATQSWKARYEFAKDILLVVGLIFFSVLSYSKGVHNISNEHLEAVISTLLVIAIGLTLIRKRVQYKGNQ